MGEFTRFEFLCCATAIYTANRQIHIASVVRRHYKKINREEKIIDKIRSAEHFKPIKDSTNDTRKN